MLGTRGEGRRADDMKSNHSLLADLLPRAVADGRDDRQWAAAAAAYHRDAPGVLDASDVVEC